MVDLSDSRRIGQPVSHPPEGGSAGSVYAPASAVCGNIGVDLKFGLSSAFTLDLTANPDFGQVEADPAVVIACGDSECEIDRDSDGVPDASFARPDFNFKLLRMTSVLRWEYVPGSVLFVAWQHGRSDRGLDGDFGGLGAMGDLFSLETDNTVLVKVSYWLGL